MREPPRHGLSPLLKALRPKQWTKNVVVLAAYFFARWDPSQQAHALGLEPLIHVVLGVGLFCTVSSAIYLLNDLLDVEADRAHPQKRHRAIASGALPVRTAWTACGLLLALGLGGAGLLSRDFAVIVLAYVALQVVYTLRLKRVPLVDIFMIALGFVLRAVSGAAVIAVRISPWLLLCTFLLALFLALCKRRHEKHLLPAEDTQTRVALAGYDDLLLDQLIAIASAATIVCYAIYTLSEETVLRFGTSRLGLTIPLVVFGIFRYLDLVYRRHEGGRPEQLLLTDRVLMVTVLLYGLTALAVLMTA